LELKNAGMKMSYAGVHVWIKRLRGKAVRCEKCFRSDDKTVYDWSNVSGNYLRDLTDWQQLCRACHIRYDDMPTKRRMTMATKYPNGVGLVRGKNGQYLRKQHQI
jgi:hypothetical protein